MDRLDRIKGAIVGSAIGDALGYAEGSVEFDATITPKNPKVFLETLPGRYSDDTQMMRATCEGIIRAQPRNAHDEDIHKAAEEIAEDYIQWKKAPHEGSHRAPGGACMYGVGNLADGKDWDKSGKPNGGGCGAAMRSAPYGLWFSHNVKQALRMAGEHAVMTHKLDMAQASAAAIAAGVAPAFYATDPLDIARQYCMAAQHYHDKTGQMCAQAMMFAWKETKPPEWDAPDWLVLDMWRGWAGHEAVAASLYCFLSHPESFEDAVLLAVNSPGDSDSLGAITGALSGAYLGYDAIPEHWAQAVERSDELEYLAQRFAAANVKVFG